MGDFVKLIKEKVVMDKESLIFTRQFTIEVRGIGSIDGLCSKEAARQEKIGILGRELLDILENVNPQRTNAPNHICKECEESMESLENVNP